jgi:hypothetical protein
VRNDLCSQKSVFDEWKNDFSPVKSILHTPEKWGATNRYNSS